jgi:hypothetical protein
MLENYNLNPYYDDYSDDKNFHRLLFKPSFAVQARELTQIQTILQKQVERFGDSIYKKGSVVTGGQFHYQDAIALSLDTEYSNTTVMVDNFDGKTLLANSASKRAEVIKVYDADLGTNEPKTLLVKQLYGDDFVPGEIVYTSEDSSYFAAISSNGVSTAKTFSVNEGVFYFDGFFIKTAPQTIAISKYTSANVFCRIGFDVVETVIQASSDTSLLDPALGSSNYQAPGADRVKLELVLSIRTLDSTDDEKFIELTRIEDSVITKESRYPMYSVLEETLARRTYDESGNYTVRPFKISLQDNEANTAQTDIVLSPGKGYVYGYEFETSSPTTITIPKPRETQVIQNKRLSADFGGFFYTKDHYGSWPINTLGTLDIHCVDRASIATTNASTILSTKIGTAKIKAVEYESAANTLNSDTYVYRSYIFDIAVNNSITGNVVSSSGSNLTIGGTEIISSVNNAYVGAKLRITTGLGSGEPVKTITAYNGTTKTITLNKPFILPPTSSSQYRIDFDVKDIESLTMFSGTTLTNGANIDDRSKDLSKTYQDVYLADQKLEPLVFPLGDSFITQNTVTDMSYSYKRLYSNQVFAAGESPSLSIGTGESLASGATTSAKNDNFLITVLTSGGSSYSTGDIVSSDKFTIDTNTRKISVVGGSSMTANIIATIDITLPTRKQKTLVQANTEIVASTSAVDVFSNNSVIIFGSEGQTVIANTFVNRIPNSSQSLFVSDVVTLVKVLDFEGASPNTANLSGARDVTSKYTLDNGQRDSYYDHASIRLNAGARPPVGPIVVYYNRFTSSGSGFFTVDSYSGIEYGDIPSFISTNGNNYSLRDCLDFRPVRFDATTGSGSTVLFDVDSNTTGPKIPKNGSDIIIDYAHYLPRIDKVILDKTKTFEVIQGTPDMDPTTPNDKPTGMTLYVLTHGAYVADSSQISVEYKNNKRYTMRDIGTIEKRVDNLEYYTSLSLLEQSTLTKQDLTITDTTGLPRIKNGILVDSFTGSSVADVSNPDYAASIDPMKNELRPSFDIKSYSLVFNPDGSSNYLQSGPFVTSNAASVTIIDQPRASKILNVNPFNVINYLGKITLNPQTDIWQDTQSKPEVLVNMTGDADAWELLTANAISTEWGAWQNRWTGSTTTGGEWRGWLGPTGTWSQAFGTQTTTTTTGQARTGTQTTVVPATITQSIGNRVVDVSVIPYMRSIGTVFVGSDFKPNWPLYPFFDNVSVINNVARANKFTVSTNNLGYRTTTSNYETVVVSDSPTGSGSYYSSLAVKTSNNELFIINADAISTPASNTFVGKYLVGLSTGTSKLITAYEHNSGKVDSATANTITLSIAATGATNLSNYVGSVIYIINGTGTGQKAIIQSYNSLTRVVSITGTWTTIPDTTSFYSIGTLKTSETGAVAGVFVIPTGVFRTGEKTFRLVDTSSGDIGSSSTNGDASFYSQGLLQTTEETILSTTVPQIQRTVVNDNRITTSSTSQRVVIGYYDPLAQTFLISPTQFPEGMFLSKIRVCFKSKDSVIPITLQVRPTVNGYPSSSVVYPHGTVSLTPDKVKVADSPSLDDPSKYTDFVFDAPIYMQPGEHSFAILANSNKYEMYIAQIGATDMVTQRLISEQPYGGSLFLSQNGSTWTADQNSDMMFRMFRYTFSTSPTVAQFVMEYPDTAVTPYDLTHLIAESVSMANTSLNYQFNSETLSSGYVGYQPISPLTDYDMNVDGFGTRVFNPATGNSTFVLNAVLDNLTSDVTPFLDISRMGFIAVNNKINNLGLSNTNIVVANTGSGYANSDDITVTITNGGGSGALARANVVNGSIDFVYIEDTGSSYTGTPTITITPGSGGGSGANVVAIGETSASGGPAEARYITRSITLNDGFDSGDLRVYLTAYRPKEALIYVYVKMLSVSDPETFEDKGWTLLTQLGNANFVSLNSTDYRELLYAPGAGGVANNSVSYVSNGVSYDTFRTFAIKIVMAGTNSSDVPKIRDLRVIALPASVQ